jgi:epoxyqueuosine reductase QueG
MAEVVIKTNELKRFAEHCGADLVGIADLALLEGIRTIPDNLLDGYKTAVSIGVRLSDGVIDAIVDSPTPLYQQHYARVNVLLDEIALRVCRFVEKVGGRALPIPASQLLDKAGWHSYLSHKAVAIAAGLGWQGKSLLVVSQVHGPRIRLVSVLTDLRLEPDRPLKNKCGACSACAEACPAEAIKNVNTSSHYGSRDEALYFDRCVSKVTQEFTRLPFIDNPICGVCIRACPWGQRQGRSRKRGPLHEMI